MKIILIFLDKKMKFDKKLTCLTFYIIILMLLNGVQVEGQMSPRFQRIYITKESLEASFAKILKKFEEKLRLDQAEKLEQEKETKRNQIFRNTLLSRISGSFLNDFHTIRF
jgi:hypothetical protein